MEVAIQTVVAKQQDGKRRDSANDLARLSSRIRRAYLEDQNAFSQFFMDAGLKIKISLNTLNKRRSSNKAFCHWATLHYPVDEDRLTDLDHIYDGI